MFFFLPEYRCPLFRDHDSNGDRVSRRPFSSPSVARSPRDGLRDVPVISLYFERGIARSATDGKSCARSVAARKSQKLEMRAPLDAAGHPIRKRRVAPGAPFARNYSRTRSIPKFIMVEPATSRHL